MPSYRGSKSKQVPVTAAPYKCELVDVREESNDFGEQLCWEFQIVAGPCDGQKLFGWCSQVEPSQKNKIGRWLGGLIGETVLPDGAEIDTDNYVGQLYSVWVKANEAGDRTRVDRFLPIKARTQTKTSKVDSQFSESIVEASAGALPDDGDDIPF